MNLWPFSKKPKAIEDSHFDLPPGVVLAAPSEADNMPPAYFPQPDAPVSTPAFFEPQPHALVPAAFQDEPSFSSPSGIGLEPTEAFSFPETAFETPLPSPQVQAPLSSHLLDLLVPPVSAEVGPWPGTESIQATVAEATPIFQSEPFANTPQATATEAFPTAGFETAFDAHQPVASAPVQGFEPTTAETSNSTETWGWESCAMPEASSFATTEIGWETSFDEPAAATAELSNVITFPQEQANSAIHGFTAPMDTLGMETGTDAGLEAFGLTTDAEPVSNSFLFETPVEETLVSQPLNSDLARSEFNLPEEALSPDFLDADMLEPNAATSFFSETEDPEYLAPPAETETAAHWDNLAFSEPGSIVLTEDEPECDSFETEDAGPVGDLESYDLGYYDDPEEALPTLDLDQADKPIPTLNRLPEDDETASYSNVVPFSRPGDALIEQEPIEDLEDWQDFQESPAEPLYEYDAGALVSPSDALASLSHPTMQGSSSQAKPRPETPAYFHPSITGAIDSFEKQVILEDSRFIKRSIDELVERYFSQQNDEPAF